MSEKNLEIADNIFAEVGTYRGKTTLDLRQWYSTRDGEMARTQKGFKLTKEEWEDFKANWEEFVEFVNKGFGIKEK